jgi:hypothetical protein
VCSELRAAERFFEAAIKALNKDIGFSVFLRGSTYLWHLRTESKEMRVLL